MKSAIPVVAMLFLLVAAPSAAKANTAERISEAALAAAGRQATLKQIDYGEDHCDSAMTVEAWLNALVGEQARAVTWTGGQCETAIEFHPGIDAASWPYCARATITLVHPRSGCDSPMIEIYFEKPDHGHPGIAYAFRSIMMTRDDGPGYERFRRDFEAECDERFPPAPGATRCQDE